MARRRRWIGVIVVGLTVAALERRVVRPWMYTWGATREEVDAVLPGDELVSPRTPVTTRAVSIDAPVGSVWQWLVQIGEDRGGFYSYAWPERAIGARIRNADTVHPEWQRREVGDTVWLAQRYGEDLGRMVVAAVEQNSHLVLMPPSYYAGVQQHGKATGAWIFCLRADGDRTRLLVRGSGGAIGHLIYDLAHFVMEQKMLRGIRDRAQRIASTH